MPVKAMSTFYHHALRFATIFVKFSDKIFPGIHWSALDASSLRPAQQLEGPAAAFLHTGTALKSEKVITMVVENAKVTEVKEAKEKAAKKTTTKKSTAKKEEAAEEVKEEKKTTTKKSTKKAE